MTVGGGSGSDNRGNDRAAWWKLAEWPLRWKVAAVLAVPLVLAGTFGALRVQSQLDRAAQLSAAADHAAIVAPAVAVRDATEGLALAAVSGSGAQPALAEFDAAAAALDAPAKRLDAATAGDLASAVGTASSLRNDVATTQVSTPRVTDNANSVSQKIAAAIASAMAGVDDVSIDNQVDRLRSTLDARRALETQRILVAAPATPNDPGARAGVLAATGSEVAILDQLATMDGVAQDDVTALREAAQARRATFTESPAVEAGSNAEAQVRDAATSGDASAERYQRITDGYVTELDDSVHSGATELRSSALRDTAIVLGAVLAAFALALLVATSLIDPIRKLRLGALQVARRSLPDEIERVRDGKQMSAFTPVDVHTREEIGQLARAVDDIHSQALRLAGDQASLRVQIGDMFETLSRRSRTLVEKQLALIENLELDEDDPQRLESLFQLDHLATRMRRNGDNLLVLSGTPTPKGSFDPIPLADVLRGALSEVEDYQRVEIGGAPDGSLVGSDAADVVHLTAELIDNALRYSPPDSRVSVTSARAIDGGYLIDIADRGIGIHHEDLKAANARLASGGEVTAETARRMGLFVVGRLAARHGITVRLRPTNAGAARPGVSASVHIPATAIVATHSQLARSGGSTNGSPVNGSLRNGSPLDGSPLDGSLRNGSPLNGSPLNGTAANGAAAAVNGSATGSSVAAADSPSDAAESVTPTTQPASIGTRRAATRSGSNPVRASRTPSYGLDDSRQADSSQATPIFQRMASEWLLDPNSTTNGTGTSDRWSSPSDAGWTAARSATGSTGARTASGLPQRRPGARLIPGGAATAPAGANPAQQPKPTPQGPSSPSAQPAPMRDAEAIRAALNDHVSGVRDGRARVIDKRDENEGAR